MLCYLLLILHAAQSTVHLVTDMHDGIQFLPVLVLMTNALEKNILGEDVGTDREFNRHYVRQVSVQPPGTCSPK